MHCCSAQRLQYLLWGQRSGNLASICKQILVQRKGLNKSYAHDLTHFWHLFHILFNFVAKRNEWTLILIIENEKKKKKTIPSRCKLWTAIFLSAKFSHKYEKDKLNREYSIVDSLIFWGKNYRISKMFLKNKSPHFPFTFGLVANFVCIL